MTPSTACSDDDWNFCIYTPWKGVVQFHVNEGDMKLWIAGMYAVLREMEPTFDIMKSVSWLDKMKEMMRKSARAANPQVQESPRGEKDVV